ncbi:MAG: hypothetical protein H6981_07390 [Gammaproteobacteria bacterium]|nr:hypothetical protein [Gammaproteobacteria bacterium]
MSDTEKETWNPDWLDAVWIAVWLVLSQAYLLPTRFAEGAGLLELLVTFLMQAVIIGLPLAWLMSKVYRPIRAMLPRRPAD